MKFKKIIAGIVASTLTITSIAISNVFADEKAADFSVNWPVGTPIASSNPGDAAENWENTKFVDNSSAEMKDVNLAGVDKVVFNAIVWDTGYGWNNGAFYTNSNGAEYKSVSFGGSEAGKDVTFNAPGRFSVEVEIGITETTW
ncbi:MAG: hypothetical protein K2N36_02720, partial [Ruminiclostridium sp.]|nr:hypothetical protein [Ruminiclostridium sp.]